MLEPEEPLSGAGGGNARGHFHAASLLPDQIERIKLEDGMRLHEQVKTDLDLYASENGKPRVKPFVLVVGTDTTHAKALLELIQSDAFFDGRYRGKAIRIDSDLTGDEKEKYFEELLAVEKPDNETEIVVHVNMLKEGWDVTNLYTIIPLRAADARTLIEQTIGRGLRLPYGRRTGVTAVDRLTIVAHDRFQSIVEEARRPDSILQRIDTVMLGKNGPPDAPRVVDCAPTATGAIVEALTRPAPATGPTAAPVRALSTETATAIATATVGAIAAEEHLPASEKLLETSVQDRLVERVVQTMPAQLSLLEGGPGALRDAVRRATQAFVAVTIDLPDIRMPEKDAIVEYADFELDTSDVRYQPVSETILTQHLRDQRKERLSTTSGGIGAPKLSHLIVRALMDYRDLDYGVNAPRIYALADAMVAHLVGSLGDEQKARNVTLYHERELARIIHGQMVAHRRIRTSGYTILVAKGFRKLPHQRVTLRPGETARSVRAPVAEKRDIPSLVFTGFVKSGYSEVKLDSDGERRFVVVLEDDAAVQKWVRPPRSALRIDLRGGDGYEPDFVVETADRRYVVEIKARSEIDNAEVQEKARAAAVWCHFATRHAVENSGKAWSYVLIPDDAVAENMTLSGLAARFGRPARDDEIAQVTSGTP